ncbi:hypothetical protein [Leptothoe sp. PORK10 BA2]|uniref:hypothetical protein n=1 Tax=Leptothoe sp. PORK10 BA2 TaxID=3110254 RepID=UPI002B1EC613|nr:hypothetical protein [Leptothoe sp. PORK10 BA2]MEA5465403.1 hypothetical protein [Leptothoe sp. PORK10 BA2]
MPKNAMGMTMLDDQNPLRSQLEDELNGSEWLQKFKAINRLLHSLKADVPEMDACELKWDTATHGLVIHCPSVDIGERLRAKHSEIVAIASYADRITLVQPDSAAIILKD